jgi:2-polyprenyl-3-methyl-5-hydroxy-6-metoxy-1,4-benzoquinol methylase
MEKKHLDRFLAQIKKEGKVLDLGCGSGRPMASYILSQGFSVKGIDGSDKMIELAKRYVPSIDPEVQDMRHLNLSEKFDGIIMWHSSFHLPYDDQRILLPKLAEILNPKGSLLFTSGPGQGEAWGENHGESLYHASLSQDEYRKILGEAGFKVISLDVEDKSAGGATVWLCRL